MNYTLDNPKGADRVAQKLQSRIHDHIGWNNIDVYGIVEKNLNSEFQPVLEAYAGENEYKDVLFNDDKAASIFIVDDGAHLSKDGIRFEALLTVVFIVDLKKLYPLETHRAKQEAQLQAIKLLRETQVFKFDRFEKGVRAALGNFFYNELIQFDMHPYTTFSISGYVNYTVSCLID